MGKGPGLRWQPEECQTWIQLVAKEETAWRRDKPDVVI